MKLRKKQLVSLLCLLAAALAGIFFSATTKATLPDPAHLVIKFIDVGQGDSTLIITQGQTALIDAGTGDSYENIKHTLDKMGITKIDHFIATHPHIDHIGSATQLLENYNVGIYYHSGVTPTTYTAKRTLTFAKEFAGSLVVANTGTVITMGNTTLTVLAPDTGFSSDNLNNHSIVLRLDRPGFSALFMGDAESQVEGMLLNHSDSLKVNLLKVGHHGSYTSSTEKFLQAVMPEYSVISAGAGNQYGLPHQIILNRLEGAASKVLRTDLSGTITVTFSDGALTTAVSRP